MSAREIPIPPIPRVLPNGPGLAAILAAGIGCFSLSIFAIAADQSPAVKSFLNVYKPTGALSGVTTLAIIVWLLTWLVLYLRWRIKSLTAGKITAVALAFLCLALALSFPPIADLF